MDLNEGGRDGVQYIQVLCSEGKKQSALKSKSGFAGGDKEINPDPAGSRNSRCRHYVELCRFVCTVRSAHTVHLCVLCGSQNKQPLFPYTALTGRFL